MNRVITHGFSGSIHGSPHVMYAVGTNNRHLVASDSDDGILSYFPSLVIVDESSWDSVA